MPVRSDNRVDPAVRAAGRPGGSTRRARVLRRQGAREAARPAAAGPGALREARGPASLVGGGLPAKPAPPDACSAPRPARPPRVEVRRSQTRAARAATPQAPPCEAQRPRPRRAPRAPGVVARPERPPWRRGQAGGQLRRPRSSGDALGRHGGLRAGLGAPRWCGRELTCSEGRPPARSWR